MTNTLFFVTIRIAIFYSIYCYCCYYCHNYYCCLYFLYNMLLFLKIKTNTNCKWTAATSLIFWYTYTQNNMYAAESFELPDEYKSTFISKLTLLKKNELLRCEICEFYYRLQTYVESFAFEEHLVELRRFLFCVYN